MRLSGDGYEDKAIRLADNSDVSHYYTKGSTVVDIEGERHELLLEFGGDVPEIVDLATSYPHEITTLYLHGDGPTAKMLNNHDDTPRTDFSKITVYNDPDDSEPLPDLTYE